jgi:hypothetical protein
MRNVDEEAGFFISAGKAQLLRKDTNCFQFFSHQFSVFD